MLYDIIVPESYITFDMSYDYVTVNMTCVITL